MKGLIRHRKLTFTKATFSVCYRSDNDGYGFLSHLWCGGFFYEKRQVSESYKPAFLPSEIRGI